MDERVKGVDSKIGLPVGALVTAICLVELAAGCTTQATDRENVMDSDAAAATHATPLDTGGVYDELESYLRERETEFDRIDADRRSLLDGLAGFVASPPAGVGRVRLTFVCTHNSRRSHMSQLWAAAAATRHGLDVETYSGGTEATAFNPRAVAAMRRAGFRVVATGTGDNPVYRASHAYAAAAAACFSTLFDAPPNPTSGFAAVMVCTSADEACPSVPGAASRFAIPFDDPKASDGTPAEEATYDKRCAQIAREMLYVMKRASVMASSSTAIDADADSAGGVVAQ
jgi:hypothetical protein